MITLSFPAYSTPTNSISLRPPENFNTDSVKGRLQPMLMSDGSFRTYTKTITGRSFDMIFNIYEKEEMLDAVIFFEAFNGDYLKYTDQNGENWTLQILDKEIEVEPISRNHWQFPLTGLRFGTDETGSGGTYVSLPLGY